MNRIVEQEMKQLDEKMTQIDKLQKDSSLDEYILKIESQIDDNVEIKEKLTKYFKKEILERIDYLEMKNALTKLEEPTTSKKQMLFKKVAKVLKVAMFTSICFGITNIYVNSFECIGQERVTKNNNEIMKNINSVMQEFINSNTKILFEPILKK